MIDLEERASFPPAPMLFRLLKWLELFLVIKIKMAFALGVAGMAAASVGFAASASASSSGAQQAGQCQVVVNRSREAGVLDVTRQQSAGGGCVCYVYTGPVTQAASVNSSVSTIEQSRSCPNARVANLPDSPAGIGAPAAVLGAAVLAGGIAAALGGPSSP